MLDKKILIIDDDELLAGAVKRKLENSGFNVRSAIRGFEGRELFKTWNPELIVLDLSLPDDDGIDICHDIRQDSMVPIIMLTGRVEETDRIVGLEMGADDFLTKPFSLTELVARVNAILRRVKQPQNIVSEESIVEGMGVYIDFRTREVLVDGIGVILTPNEYQILTTFMKRQGQIIEAKELLAIVWGDETLGLHIVEAHIANLRLKIEVDPQHPERIQTLRSFGYRFGHG